MISSGNVHICLPDSSTTLSVLCHWAISSVDAPTLDTGCTSTAEVFRKMLLLIN